MRCTIRVFEPCDGSAVYLIVIIARSITLLLIAWTGVALAAEYGPVRRDHITVQLIAEHDRIAPGGEVALGLRLAHDPEWHTYWENAGDSGLATRLAWSLPEGVEAGPIEWPIPKRLPIGPLTNYGFEGEMVLPVRLRAAAQLAPGTTLPIVLRASWLVCKVECIPGDATLALDLRVDSESGGFDPRWVDLFAAARAAAPTPVNWPAALADEGDAIALRVTPQARWPESVTLELYPRAPQLLATALGTVTREAGAIVIRSARSDSFVALPPRAGFVLVASDGAERRGYQFEAVSGPDLAIAISAASATGSGGAGGALSLLAAVGFALLGGLLLNLMPCVFPVLALKAMGVVAHVHERAGIRRHAWFYLAGVVSSFLVLAGTLLALRGLGEQLGWGFQLQTPWVVAALALVMLAMGLSLAGVFEIGGRWMNAGSALASQAGDRGAFFSGVLACVVASPCTAPFMGPALGYAVTQPAAIALLVFAALGIGLALPLLALAYRPGLARLLPRPGAWMDRFKQLLAFPMYLTAVWLLWVLGRQTGADGMAIALLGATALGFALWAAGNVSGVVWRRALVAAGFAATLSTLMLLGRVSSEAALAARGSSAGAAEPWSTERLGTLRSEGRPVLVNMTAAWCITCLANERVALSSSAFAERLDQLDIAYLKGDWTQRDAAITRYLAEFGRNGVPLYVLYPRGGGEPTVLPQLLTPDLVLAALDSAASTAPVPLATAVPLP